MGWSGGTDVFNGVWGAVRSYVPKSTRATVARKVVEVLEEMDWDNVDEIVRDDWPETVAAAGLEKCPGCDMPQHPTEIRNGKCWNCG